jgi:uncharacterized linocin/CFP29 family protein
MNITKREIAPITDKAWDALSHEASRALRSNLSARKIVDVVGPKGLDFAAVSLGRLAVPSEAGPEGVGFGVHQVLPLVESRVPFELSDWELDNVERGARDIDLAPLTDAARRISAFEEKAIYFGFAPGHIKGMVPSAPGEPIPIGADADHYADAVARALVVFQGREVEGPFALVLGRAAFAAVQAGSPGYPPRKQVEQLIGERIFYSPYVDGGVLVSQRKGDFELTLGQDFFLGYESHDTRRVRLFLAESFTFRILNPDGAVRLSWQPEPPVLRPS